MDTWKKGDRRPLLALAPLAGLSHAGFRTLVSQYGGCDLYFSEMTSADSLLSGGNYEEYYLKMDPDPAKFILQLVSGKRETLVQAVQRLHHLPLRGFDINMGCSAPNIVRKGGGYGWMDRRDEALRLVDEVKAAAGEKHVSVKMRVADVQDVDDFVGFVVGLENAGADMLTVHPKTRKQSFNRPGFPEFIGHAAKALSIPVIGNGDVRTVEDVETMHTAYGPAGVMVGRAVLKAPWFFKGVARMCNTSTNTMQFDTAVCVSRFIELLKEHQPPDFHLSRAMLFFRYFNTRFKFWHDLNKRIQRRGDVDGMLQEVLSYIERNSDERIVTIPTIAPSHAT